MLKRLLISLFALFIPGLKPVPTITPIITPEVAIVSPAPTKIPRQYLIKTTFVPQAPEQNWDQPWQDACEEAALLTAVYYYQQKQPDLITIKSDLQKIFAFEESQGWSHDVNLNQMSLIGSNLFHLRPLILYQPTIETIKEKIAQNIPVIVPANGKTLFRENRNFTHGGPYYHNLTILGYNDLWQKFTVHDVGTRKGAYFQYSYQLLYDSIHDFPDSGKKEDIDTGPKNVLVLLKD